MFNKILLLLLILPFISCVDNELNSTFTETPFNMSIYELDKLMSCSIILSLKAERDNNKILNFLKKFNETTKSKAEGKILTEMFENCVNNIDNKTISKFFNNFTYTLNSEYLNEYDKFLKPNYEKYNENSDFDLTVSQQILSYQFEKVKEVYEQKQAQLRLEMNQKINIGNYDITQMPSYVKSIIFILVFGIFIFGTLYFLKKLVKKPESNKKKKKKN